MQPYHKQHCSQALSLNLVNGKTLGRETTVNIVKCGNNIFHKKYYLPIFNVTVIILRDMVESVILENDEA